eukprot:scaffold27241_cov114-Isochrysis_galbana.AAC.4
MEAGDSAGLGAQTEPPQPNRHKRPATTAPIRQEARRARNLHPFSPLCAWPQPGCRCAVGRPAGEQENSPAVLSPQVLHARSTNENSPVVACIRRPRARPRRVVPVVRQQDGGPHRPWHKARAFVVQRRPNMVAAAAGVPKRERIPQVFLHRLKVERGGPDARCAAVPRAAV